MTTLGGEPGLRIHFTREDLARTTVAGAPDTLWELILSLCWLHRQKPAGQGGPSLPPDITTWRGDAVARLSRQALGHQVRDYLLPLVPLASYFPDFLTPYDGLDGVESGLDTLLSTPRQRIAQELDRLTSRSGAPSWGADLATGNVQALRLLGDTMRSYFSTALAPHWSAIDARITAEHTRLLALRAVGGVEAALSALRPVAVWNAVDRVLHAPYPMTRDIHLRGQGLTLIPSWFCRTTPVALVDPDLPPVLVYPLAHDTPSTTDPDALAKLIGPTRAIILTAISTGTPTSAILRNAGVTPSQLSRHAAVLRHNCLIIEARHHGQVFYTRTALGDALATNQHVTQMAPEHRR